MYYCMRAEKVFDDAQVTQTEIEDSGREYKEEKDLSASLKKFGRMWEKLVESMLKEWETTNVVAALLLSSTLTLSQISGVNGNPTLRNTSFLSLVCALMCILHGSLQLVQFGSLKTARQGLSWMEEKGKSQFEWPLMWACIALPVLFFGASLLWFMGTIFGYMWVIDPVFKIPQHQPDYIQTCFWQTMILVYLVIGMGSWAVVLAMMYFYAVQEYKNKVVRDKGREQC
ncbi:hypothetical protein APHAL10511_008659 [Amanita phalloides]|nr:hypothetical protein APHAL10511_008659 [Amanita phalloides]